MSRYADIKKSRPQKTKEEKKPETVNKSRYQSIKMNRGERNYGVDADYINTFIQNANKFFSASQDDYKNLTWKSGTDKDKIQSRSETMADLGSRSATIRAYANANKSNLNETTYKDLMSLLDKVDSNRNRVFQTFYDVEKLYSSFKDEEEYKFWEALKDPEKRQDFYQEKQTKLDELGGLLDNYNTIDLWYQDYLERPWDFTEEEIAEKLPIYEKYKANKQKYSSAEDVKSEIAVLETELHDYKADFEAWDNYYAKWGHFANSDDFDSVSANRNFVNPTSEDFEYYDAATDSNYFEFGYDDDGNRFAKDAFGNDLILVPSDDGLIKAGQRYASPVEMDDKYKVTDPLGLFLSTSPEYREQIVYSKQTGSEFEALREGVINHWEQLKSDEISLYYYILNAQGTDAALEYLRDTAEKLNARWGTLKAQEINGIDNGFQKFLVTGLFSIEAGLDQWGTGIVQTLTGETYPTSGVQYASNEIANSLDGFWKHAYQAGVTVGNMLPSILISKSFGATTSAAKGVGAITMGASAVGNAYGQALKEGYSEGQARAYGTLVGASEATLQYLIGGIGSLGGVTDEILLAKASVIDKTLLRLVAKFGIKIGSEIVEEELQNFLEPAFRAIIFGEGYDVPKWEEIIETAIVTALSTGVLEGGDTIAQDVAETRYLTKTGRPIVRVEGGVDALKALALEMADSADTKAQDKLRKLAEQVTASEKGGNVRRVGKLYNTVQSNVTAQNQADIAKSLERKGFSTKKAADIAEALVAEMNGKELSQHQQTVLDEVVNDENVQKAVTDIIKNDRSTVSDRSANLNAFNLDLVRKAIMQQIGKETTVEQLAMEMTEGETGNAAVNSQDAEISSAEEDGKLLDGKTFRMSTGEVVQVKTFTDFAGGKATVQLQDGTTAPAEDISFNGSDDGPFHLIATEANMTAPAANQMWQLWENIKANGLPVSAEQFGSAAISLFRAGWWGDSSILSDSDSRTAGLSKSQRELIYEAGRKARKADTDAKQANVDKVHAQAEEALGQAGSPQAGNYRAVAVDGLQIHKMNRQQRAAYEMASLIAPGVKGNMELYDGGKEWGYYDHKRDVIRLNINAKWNQTSMMTFTLGHELAHRAALGSPEKFQAFADFLVEKYVEQGTSLEELIGEQLQAADKFDRTLPEEKRLHMTETQALEEVVADACQRMLLDTDAGQRLAEFGAKSRENRSIVKDIKKWIRDFMDRVRRSFRNVMPDSKAAKDFTRFDQQTKQLLADKFVDMVLDAGEKLSTIKEAGMTEKITTDRGGNIKYKISIDMKQPSYEDLVSKKPAVIVDVGKNEHGLSYAQLKENVLKRAVEKGVFRAPHLNRDTGVSVFITQYSFTHAFSNLTANFGVDTILAMDHISEIIREAVLTHIDPPKNPAKAESRVFTFFAAIHGENGVEPIKLKVKEYNEQNPKRLPKNIREYFEENGVLETHNRLYDAVALEVIGIESAKRESGASASGTDHSRRSVAKGTPNSIIKIADLLNLVNGDAKKYIPQREEQGVMPYKLPMNRDVADREMLVDMFEQMVTSSNEYKALENYRKHIQEMLDIEEHLERISAEIRRISFAEGPRDMETLNRLKLQQKQAVNRLNTYDGILLRLEKSGVLRAMIERNRKKITQESIDSARAYYKERNERRESELRQYYRESRRKAVERHDMAQVRQQIRKDIQRLDSLLNKGTKKRNVKLGLQEIVGAALRLAKGSFLLDYNEYDMIRNGLQNSLLPEEKAAYDRCRELLAELDQIRSAKEEQKEQQRKQIRLKGFDPEQVMQQDDREEALKRELYQNMRILRDGNVFQRERAGAEDATAEQLADELLGAYQKLAETEFEHLQGLYSVKVYDQIEKTKNFLKGKAIKDMTSVELKELQKLYRMISETVSRADELFGAHRNEKTSKRGDRIRDQLATDRNADMNAFVAKLKDFWLSLLTPEAVAAVIGSEELTQAIREVEATEMVQQQDLEHAKQYAAEQAKKFNRKNWDTSRQVEFAGTEITIGQAMALYAYTERKAGRDHISGDGFTHSKSVPIKKKLGKLQISSKFIKDVTRSYRVTEDMYDALGKLLTEEQKGYARAMRDYLAEVMGAKGNEVSRELYGIEMYGEKFYFPLKSAKNFMDAALGAKRGEVKVTNKGWTNPIQEGASNAIVLEDFETVWAKHVQEMSNYHASAVAMENFNRLYNYRQTLQQEKTDDMGQFTVEEVKSKEKISLLIERRAVGATGYLTKWMESVNGGVRSDATEKLLGGLLGNFRKTAVLGNISVIIQQPTAILRAVPYLGKDFLSGWKTWKTTTPEKGLIREMYRYCPVAGLKKMGGFDPSAGQTVRQYLFDGLDDAKGKLRKGIDKTNEVLGTAPEKMDELAWSYLWLGCKKKTLRENRNLRAGSKEHCEAAAELFTKIVRETQVYDSVMSKPLIMQSKSALTKSLTSFMNEPLKGLNQCITAVARAKSGEITKGQAAEHIVCVAASNLLATAVSCLVYALRDDDEDETYWEKYLKHLSGGVLDVLIPLNSVPGLKEVVSIAQGYGNERSEFAVISDAWDGLLKLFKESKAETPEELEKEVWDKLEKGLGNISNLFGIPGRNLIREVRSIYYTVKRAGTIQATEAGVRYAVREGITGKEVSKTDQLYDAVVEDDGTHLTRVMATWDNPKTAVSYMVSAVKNAYLDGKITDDRATEYLQEFGGKSLEQVSDYLSEWGFKKAYPDSELKDSNARNYIEIAKPAGISLEIYTRFCNETEGLETDKDKDGNPIMNSERKKVWKAIDSLPLSRKQKDALHYAAGYAESSLEDAPWN